MSDFVFAARRRAPGELRVCLERYLTPVAVSFAEYHGPWGSLAIALFPHDAQCVVEDAEFLSVLVGEPIVRITAEGPGLSWQGGRRQAVHDLLRRDDTVAWDEALDGSYAALGIDRRAGAGIVVTDLFAFIPVFTATDPAGALVIGTHLDAVARASEQHLDVDLISAADLVTTLVCTHPYTLFRGVTQVAAASACRFRSGRWAGGEQSYWCPREDNPYPSRRAAALALREALVDDVRVTCAGLAEVGLLLSGGEDARAVLGAVPPKSRVYAFTFAGSENREARVARAVARAYGAEFVFGCRQQDHYIAGLEAVASMVGSHNNFMDLHGWGFHDRLGIGTRPVVLGGLSADSLLKGEHVQARPIRVEDAPGLRVELVQAVAARHEDFRRRLAAFRPHTADEWSRLWPFTMRKHSGNLHGNRRLFASHEPFHANAVVKIAAAVPAPWKRHRKLFQEAMRPLYRRSWHVPHARWRYPYFGWYANLPLAAGLRLARGVRDLVAGELGARQGPWPKWREVAQSAAAQAKWREYPIEQSPLAGIFDRATIADVHAAVQRWPSLRQLMTLQLSYLNNC